MCACVRACVRLCVCGCVCVHGMLDGWLQWCKSCSQYKVGAGQHVFHGVRVACYIYSMLHGHGTVVRRLCSCVLCATVQWHSKYSQ